MEASSKKAQLRQQLLASENDINTLSGFAANQKLPMVNFPQGLPVGPQHQPGPGYQGPYGHYPQQNLSNHDLITPVHQRANFDNNAPRKGSMASSMSMGRLFKRKEAFFDDDAGLDIGDVSGNAVSFNDIQHLRDNSGRYSILSRTTDLTPIIPVLGVGGKNNSQNNIQYRKYMNHKKKLELASGARAMSLAGNNPMNGQEMTYHDARTMSMGVMSDPRAMSMGSNAYMGPNRQMGPGPYGPGPRAMSMRPGSYGNRVPPGQRGPMPPNIRTNSLNSSMMLNQGPMQGLSPQAIRSQSLTQGGGPFPLPQRYRPNSGMPFAGPGPGPGGPPNSMYRQSPRMNGPQNARFNGVSPNATHSNDSFMNSVQEEDEKDVQAAEASRSLDPTKQETHEPLAEADQTNNDEDEEDIVYRFEGDAASPSISRKSTVKKSNSMRVRKLDLFNKGNTPAVNKALPEAPNTDNNDDDATNDNTITPKESYETEEEGSDSERLDSHKFGARGSSTSEQDNYTTASELSPQKIPILDAPKELINEPNGTNSTPKRKVIRMKSLVANTAFNNFRSPSTNSQATFSLESNSKESSDFDHQDLKTYPYSSKISIYSHDYSRPDTKDIGGEGMNNKNVQANPGTLLADELSVDERPEVLREQLDYTTLSSPKRDPSDTAFDSRSSHNSPYNRSSEYVSSNEARYEDTFGQDNSGSLHSRSGSDVNLDKFKQAPSVGTNGRIPSFAESDSGKERRKSRTSSISSKSKNFIKRLSRSGSKISEKDTDSTMKKHRSISSISSVQDVGVAKKPLRFTKEELAIMTCNNDLQNELQLVASELASLIKRELALEAQLKSRNGESEHEHQASQDRDLEAESREKSRQIAALQEKLNNERRLRFISEEHALLAEHGQTPSALKLDYEKNELYKQLLAKNDLVNQLQDKLAEVQNKADEQTDDTLLESYNELVRKNHELQSQLNNVSRNGTHQTNWFSSEDVTDVRDTFSDRDSERAEIMSLRTQRDELREMITKLTSSQSVELKIAYDKIKTLEFKLEKMTLINDKLSRREKPTGDQTPQNNASKFSGSQGGKLQGLSIVTPKHNLFDQ